MKAADIKDIAERQPFRPFTVRLTNGAQYTFNEPRNLGAPRDYRVIFFFGDSEWAMLDSENIAEVIQRQ
ncbi:MAG: hypothetical protein C5B50_28295 [Verrucomicrobia bacterium]|nr:MAG: hypothetical protein C5B50_28295 [Verrucomicrobiota bacterium]